MTDDSFDRAAAALLRERIAAWVCDHNIDDLLLADGYEEAFLGVAGNNQHTAIAVYDADKCIEILMTRDGMDYEGAKECFDFNTLGAYVGPLTPLYLTRYRPAPLPMIRRPLPPDDDRVSYDLAPDGWTYEWKKPRSSDDD